MNKTEFAQQMKQFAEQEKEIESKRTTLMKAYIQQNAPYKIGDKLEIRIPATKSTPEQIKYGFVEKIRCNYLGDFQPELKACKKDGTEHKTAHLYISWWLSNAQVTVVSQK